jgi:hypothetical protein
MSTVLPESSFVDEEAIHRKLPPPDSLADNFYVNSIRAMRSEVRRSVRSDGQPYSGPINHALENIREFDCSGWTREHLIRFQAVVISDQLAHSLFPRQYAVGEVDKAFQKIQADGFFQLSKQDVARGLWDETKGYNNFFLDLLQILPGSQTPTPRTSPKSRNIYLRIAKDNAKASLADALNSVASQRTGSGASFSPGSLMITQSNSELDLGPRETTSYSLIHNLLKYIATVEFHLWPNHPGWVPRYRLFELRVLTLVLMPSDFL